jgi:hypothetical protein
MLVPPPPVGGDQRFHLVLHTNAGTVYAPRYTLPPLWGITARAECLAVVTNQHQDGVVVKPDPRERIGPANLSWLVS